MNPPTHAKSAASPPTLRIQYVPMQFQATIARLDMDMLHGKPSPSSTNPNQIQAMFAAQPRKLEQRRQAWSFCRERNESAYQILGALLSRYTDARM